MASAVRVEVVEKVDADLVEAVGSLLPQLSSTSPAPGSEDLAVVVGSPATSLLVARDPAGAIVGMLTLVVLRLPTGVKAAIEDVVVDGSHRGKGAGAALVGAALEAALASGARSVDLTSRPSRIEANRLYQKLGFELRETNVYRYSSR